MKITITRLEIKAIARVEKKITVTPKNRREYTKTIMVKPSSPLFKIRVRLQVNEKLREGGIYTDGNLHYVCGAATTDYSLLDNITTRTSRYALPDDLILISQAYVEGSSSPGKPINF